MKVALIFWGLSRSLKKNINSIKMNILDVFKENNIEYDIYFHTYKIKLLYTNIRSNEVNLKLNFDEYKLLNPDYFIYDNLEETKKILNFKKYYSNGDPWPENNNNFSSLNNFILAMYSKLQITKLLKENMSKKNNNYKINIYQKSININNISIKNINRNIIELKNLIQKSENNNILILKKRIKNLELKINNLINKNKILTKESNIINANYADNNYDYIIYLRPDVKYLNKFNIKYFNLIDNNNVCIPNFCIFDNFNDRMFISNVKNGLIYGTLFEKLFQYSLKKKLHSETFHYDILKKEYDLTFNLIDFYFNRVRADGNELKEDFRSRRLTNCSKI